VKRISKDKHERLAREKKRKDDNLIRIEKNIPEKLEQDLGKQYLSKQISKRAISVNPREKFVLPKIHKAGKGKEQSKPLSGNEKIIDLPIETNNIDYNLDTNKDQDLLKFQNISNIKNTSQNLSISEKTSKKSPYYFNDPKYDRINEIKRKYANMQDIADEAH
jgi:hypothetical protein